VKRGGRWWLHNFHLAWRRLVVATMAMAITPDHQRKALDGRDGRYGL